MIPPEQGSVQNLRWSEYSEDCVKFNVREDVSWLLFKVGVNGLLAVLYIFIYRDSAANFHSRVKAYEAGCGRHIKPCAPSCISSGIRHIVAGLLL